MWTNYLAAQVVVLFAAARIGGLQFALEVKFSPLRWILREVEDERRSGDRCSRGNARAEQLAAVRLIVLTRTPTGLLIERA
jgi:hypothetical protein